MRGRGSFSLGLLTLVAWVRVFFSIKASNAFKIPLAPPAFAARSLPVPDVSWSFRQTECALGSFPDDHDGTLVLTRGTSAVCPSVVLGGNVFDLNDNGVSVINQTDRHSLTSGPIQSTVGGVTSNPLANLLAQGLNAGAPLEMTLEMILTNLGGEGLSSAAMVQLTHQSSNAAYFALINHPDDNSITLWLQSGGVNAFSGFNFHSPELEALLARSKNEDTPVYLAITVACASGPFGPQAELNLYYGNVGASAGLTEAPLHTTIYGLCCSRIIVPAPQETVLRIGSSGLKNKFTDESYQAKYQYVALYSFALNSTVVSDHMRAGLPNANPAVPAHAVWELEEDVVGTLNLSDARYWFDANGDQPAKFYITSLPTTGKLKLNGVALETVPVLVLAGQTLTFHTSTIDVFSTSGSTCSPENKHTNGSSYATFSYLAEDQYCDGYATTGTTNCVSPSPGVIDVCVLARNDLPTGVHNVLDPNIRVGASKIFELTPIDRDNGGIGGWDRLPSPFGTLNGTNYAANVSVKWLKSTGKFGHIGSASSTTCHTLVPVASSVPLRPASPSAFTACYYVDDSIIPSHLLSQLEIGVDTFEYQFSDQTGSFGPINTVSFRVITSIDACQTPSTNPLYTGPNLCASEGLEDKQSSVYMVGADTRNRELIYEITSLPKHGALHANIGGAVPPWIAGPELQIGDLVEAVQGDRPNAIYVPEPYYYNYVKYSTYLLQPPRALVSYSTYPGAGLDPCSAMGKAACACDASISPGCRDVFQFRAVAKASPHERSGSMDYSLAVASVVSSYASLQAPLEVSAVAGGQKVKFAQNLSITLDERDGDVYMIGVSITASKGSLSMTYKKANPPDFQLSASCLDALETGCATLQFRTYPSRAKEALAQLEYFTAREVVSEVDFIQIKVFKPSPNGAVVESISDTALYASVPIAEARIQLNPARGSSGASGSRSSGSTLVIGAISAAGVVLLALVACGMYKGVCMAKKAVEEVRESMRPRSTRGLSTRTSHRFAMQSYGYEGHEFNLNSGEPTDPHPSSSNHVGARHPHLSYDEESPKIPDWRRSRRSHASRSHASRSHASSFYQDNTPVPPTPNELVMSSTNHSESLITDWEKMVDEHANSYFYNPRTNESRWVLRMLDGTLIHP